MYLEEQAEYRKVKEAKIDAQREIMLDTLKGEGLLANASAMGAHLREGVRGLCGEDSVIGDVRGAGLFVRDTNSKFESRTHKQASFIGTEARRDALRDAKTGLHQERYCHSGTYQYS